MVRKGGHTATDWLSRLSQVLGLSVVQLSSLFSALLPNALWGSQHFFGCMYSLDTSLLIHLNIPELLFKSQEQTVQMSVPQRGRRANRSEGVYPTRNGSHRLCVTLKYVLHDFQIVKIN